MPEKVAITITRDIVNGSLWAPWKAGRQGATPELPSGSGRRAAGSDVMVAGRGSAHAWKLVEAAMKISCKTPHCVNRS